MSIRLSITAATVVVSALLGGCSTLMGGDSMSDPDGSKRLERLQLLNQGLSSYYTARTGYAPTTGYAPVYTPPTTSAPAPQSARRCRDPEVVCSNGDARCLAELRAIPLCRR